MCVYNLFFFFFRKCWTLYKKHFMLDVQVGTYSILVTVCKIFSDKINWAYNIHLFSLNLLFHIPRLDFKRKVIFHQIFFYSKCILIAMILVFIYLFCLFVANIVCYCNVFTLTSRRHFLFFIFHFPLLCLMFHFALLRQKEQQPNNNE